MAESKFVKANEKIAETVVGGYKKIEEGVVGGFGKITDKFVGEFLTHEGESVEEAKERLAAEQAACEEAAKAEAEKRVAAQQAIVGSSGDIAKASVEASKNAGKRH